MPMCLSIFRFDDGPPDRQALLRDLRHELGPGAERRFDAIELRGNEAWLSSMDPLPLIYGAKVCQTLGGVATFPGAAGDLYVPLPPWAEVPWHEHSLLKRLRLRLLGRIRFGPVPR